MDGQQYKMPRPGMDGPGTGRRRVPGAHGGARAEALNAHYGSENEGRAALSDIQPLDEGKRRHIERMYGLYDEFEQVLRPEHDRMSFETYILITATYLHANLSSCVLHLT